MAKRGRAIFWVSALGLSCVWSGQGGAADLAPAGFEAPVLDHVVAGSTGPALADYRFAGQTDWPALRFFAAKPLDWSAAGALAVPVENPGDVSFRLLLRIDDRTDANGDDRSLTGTIDIPPHETGTVVLPLDAAPIGMVARPPARGTSAPGDLLVREVRGSVDLAHVTALHMSGVRSDVDQTLRLGAIVLRAAGPRQTGPIVDRFGQAIDGQWPEKVASVADLRTKRRAADAETMRLSRDSPAPADRFGGVDPQTRLAATGYFRVQRLEGRWSLVTPAGHRFFSLGVDSVSPSNPTIVEGRRELFAAPPSAKVFDIGQADVEAALGPNWRAPWRRQTLARLNAWGFNTLGNWSSADVTAGATMPFVEFYDVEGDSAKIEMPGGRSLSDPFDPRFASVADALAKAMTEAHRDDPFLLGYFSGNELPWGSEDRPEQGIAAQVFGLGPESPARQALMEGFQARYGTLAAFSAAWGLPLAASWDDLVSHPPPWPTTITAAAKRDIADYQRSFAMLYFSTVAQAIRLHDPHHLYLGTRFADAPSEVVEACVRWCDVMSFNVYGRSPESRASAWHPYGKPVLIGEFHFGSTDRGSFWPGMVEVRSEGERGPAYAAYVAGAVEDPQIVGAHWYQYADEPLTGRPYDGENGHIGLVAVTDLPFARFVNDVAAANRRALAAFAGQGRPELRGSE